MEIVKITDRAALAEYFLNDVSLHFYSLGDLDDFYWHNTTCFGLSTQSGINQIALLYQGKDIPVLLALAEPGTFTGEYLKGLISNLPNQLHAHLSLDLISFFNADYEVTDLGKHYKMDFRHPPPITSKQLENTTQITAKDLPDINTLYQISYSDNAFDPRMLLTGQYYGYRLNGKLISIAGIHVYSPTYRVAALGNITTHPDYRNRGFGRAVTLRLVDSIREKVDFIGLNVRQDNLPAIRLYRSLGFEISHQYGEFSLKKHP